MPEPTKPEAGTWWRFDSYRVRDGLIRPTSRAKLIEYDPWEGFRRLRSSPGQRTRQPRHRKLDDKHASKGGGELLPYQSLIDLVAETQDASPAKTEKVVTAWCSEHGLLGLLLHRVQSVVFEPRWQRFPGPIPTLENKGRRKRGSYYHAPVLHRYYRTMEGWRSTEIENRDAAKTGRMTKRALLSVPHDCIPDSWPRPSVLATPGPDKPHAFEHGPLVPAWARFFPGADHANVTPEACPLPHDSKFWRTYGEPLADFLNTARQLRDALAFLCMEDERMDEGLRTVQAFAAPVNIVLIPTGSGKFEQRWASPSLLATFAMMLTQYLAHPTARPLACPVCTTPFVSANYQARYCSTRCYRNRNQRNWRAGEKGKAYAEEERAERRRVRGQ